MIPLYIKGFLPQQNGSAIMMPAEITTITGASFNYDKLFILIPEFRTCRYDMESAKVDYYRARGLKRDVLTHSKGCLLYTSRCV